MQGAGRRGVQVYERVRRNDELGPVTRQAGFLNKLKRKAPQCGAFLSKRYARFADLRRRFVVFFAAFFVAFLRFFAAMVLEISWDD